jgi:hypothetical protein
MKAAFVILSFLGFTCFAAEPTNQQILKGDFYLALNADMPKFKYNASKEKEPVPKINLVNILFKSKEATKEAVIDWMQAKNSMAKLNRTGQPLIKEVGGKIWIYPCNHWNGIKWTNAWVLVFNDDGLLIQHSYKDWNFKGHVVAGLAHNK